MHTSHVKKFLLASKSSSRYRLLKNAGLAFQTAMPNCDEGHIKAQLLKSKISIKNLAKHLAREKAMSVSNKTNNLVVGSDTIIIFQNTLINKAKNLSQAKSKLKKTVWKKTQNNISCIGVPKRETNLVCSTGVNNHLKKTKHRSD